MTNSISDDRIIRHKTYKPEFPLHSFYTSFHDTSFHDTSFRHKYQNPFLEEKKMSVFITKSIWDSFWYNY
jgi:hypothetical protein